MGADRQSRVKKVFEAASDRPLEERPSYLDEACGDDADLRHEVESLLLERERLTIGDGVSDASNDQADFIEDPLQQVRSAGIESVMDGIPDSIGRYRIVSLLGEGGMGRVYEAEDPELKRRVALKVLTPKLATDAKFLSRFKREAQTVAALSHPNVVTLYSVEESEGTHFLTMELVRGEPLHHLIPEGGFDLGEFLDRAIPLVEGLRAAHEQGIVHRDLKPGNVMVDQDGRVRILDFGLAKLHTDLPPESQEQTMTALTALTAEGAIVGTVPYMSPEQVSGQLVDQRSDIFSLGVILYEMCTGSRPFGGETAMHTMSAILRDRPLRVTEVRHDLPEHLERIVRRCLEKEPAKRYQTARVVKEELEELKREVESGQTVGFPRSAESKRWPLVVAAIGALLVIGVLWLRLGRDGEKVPRSADSLATIARPERQMIAVLPFDNLGDPGDEYFAAGMTEEITSRLAGVSGLGVISRDSTIQYAATEKPTEQIGEELGVAYLLRGTVRWARGAAGAERLRITPRLVRVSDETQFWSESYDRVMDDIFEIQSDIASRVVQSLGVKLLQPERQAIEEKPTENLEAYDLFLRGTRSAQGCETRPDRIRELERAVELDPGFGSAWASLSIWHSNSFTHCRDPTAERRALARQTLDQATRLAPTSIDTLNAAATFSMQVDKNYAEALAWIEAAGERINGSSRLLNRKAGILRRQGRWNEALDSYKRAYELDPRSFVRVRNLASTYMWLREYRAAVEYFDRVIALDREENGFSWYRKTAIFWLWRGDTKAAREVLGSVPDRIDTDYIRWTWFWQEIYAGDFRAALERLDNIPGDWIRSGIEHWPKPLIAAHAYQYLGESDRTRSSYESARRVLEAEVERAPEEAKSYRALAIAYAGLGRKADALAASRKAIEIWPIDQHPYFGITSLENLALVATLVGELDLAFETIETVLSMPALISIPLLELDPRWAPLRNDPRFEELKEKFGRVVDVP